MGHYELKVEGDTPNMKFLKIAMLEPNFYNKHDHEVLHPKFFPWFDKHNQKLGSQVNNCCKL